MRVVRKVSGMMRRRWAGTLEMRRLEELLRVLDEEMRGARQSG